MCLADKYDFHVLIESAAVGREGEKDLLLFLKSITQYPPTGEFTAGEHRMHLFSDLLVKIDTVCLLLGYSVAPLERLHPRDCAEIYKLGIKENGIYTIQPDLHRPALEVIQIYHTHKIHDSNTTSVLLVPYLVLQNLGIIKSFCLI